MPPLLSWGEPVLLRDDIDRELGKPNPGGVGAARNEPGEVKPPEPGIRPVMFAAAPMDAAAAARIADGELGIGPEPKFRWESDPEKPS
jgi:hypothetical protein